MSAGGKDGHGKELLGNESVGARPSKETHVYWGERYCVM